MVSFDSVLLPDPDPAPPTVLTLDGDSYYLIDVSKLSGRHLRLINLTMSNCPGMIPTGGLYIDDDQMYLLLTPMQHRYVDVPSILLPKNLNQQAEQLLAELHENYQGVNSLSQEDFYLRNDELFVYPGGKLLPKFADLSLPEEISPVQQEIIRCFEEIVEEDSFVRKAAVALFLRCKEKGNLAKKLSLCYLLIDALISDKEIVNYFEASRKIVEEVQGVLLPTPGCTS